MGIINEIHEEEMDKKQQEIEALKKLLNKANKRIAELEKQTGYSGGWPGPTRCNNCGNEDRD